MTWRHKGVEMAAVFSAVFPVVLALLIFVAAVLFLVCLSGDDAVSCCDSTDK